MRSILAALLAGLAVTAAPAATEATRAVVKAIEAKDCAGAVKELNAAMAAASPDAWLLGGAMFEQGLCLKPSVDKAARLYQRAAEAGRGDARSRLAALYALPAAGPDKGAALWWAQQASLPLPAVCSAPAEVRDDPDKFAKTLASWPASQLDACVYVTGVLASLDAEFALKPDESPKDAVAVDFQPAAGKVVVGFGQFGQQGNDRNPVFTGGSGLTLRSYSSELSPDQLRAMQGEAGRRELAGLVEEVAQAALARFPRPGSVDAAWRIRLRAEGPRLQ